MNLFIRSHWEKIHFLLFAWLILTTSLYSNETDNLVSSGGDGYGAVEQQYDVVIGMDGPAINGDPGDVQEINMLDDSGALDNALVKIRKMMRGKYPQGVKRFKGKYQKKIHEIYSLEDLEAFKNAIYTGDASFVEEWLCKKLDADLLKEIGTSVYGENCVFNGSLNALVSKIEDECNNETIESHKLKLVIQKIAYFLCFLAQHKEYAKNAVELVSDKDCIVSEGTYYCAGYSAIGFLVTAYILFFSGSLALQLKLINDVVDLNGLIVLACFCVSIVESYCIVTPSLCFVVAILEFILGPQIEQVENKRLQQENIQDTLSEKIEELRILLKKLWPRKKEQTS